MKTAITKSISMFADDWAHVDACAERYGIGVSAYVRVLVRDDKYYKLRGAGVEVQGEAIEYGAVYTPGYPAEEGE